MLKAEGLITLLDSMVFRWEFNVPQNEFMAITGGSGVGKTTLLNTLLGFQPITDGCLYWQQSLINQKDIAQRPFGVLFQKDNVFDHLSVEKNLALGLVPSARLNAAQQAELERAAERFQIHTLLNRKAHQLSGGQQQRVALARVFLQNKPVLLLDEPFSSLDPALRAEGLHWVRELQLEHQTTVLMVTHHLDEVSAVADSVLEGVSSDRWRQYPARTESA